MTALSELFPTGGRPPINSLIALPEGLPDTYVDPVFNWTALKTGEVLPGDGTFPNAVLKDSPSSSYAPSVLDYSPQAGSAIFSIAAGGGFLWGMSISVVTNTIYKYDLETLEYTGTSFSVETQAPSSGGLCIVGDQIAVTDLVSATVFLFELDGTYTGNSFSLAAQMTQARDITHLDGRFYVLSDTEDTVFVYEGDFTYTGISWPINPFSTVMAGIDNDGTNLILTNSSLPAVFFVTPAGASAGTTIDGSNQSTSLRSSAWRGDSLLVSDFSGLKIISYTPSGQHFTTSFSVSAQGTNPIDVAVIGSFVYVLDGTTDTVYEYNKTTGDYTGNSFSTATQTLSPVGLTANGSLLTVAGGDNNMLFEYTTAGSLSNTIDVSTIVTTLGQVYFDGVDYIVVDVSTNPDSTKRVSTSGVFTGVTVASPLNASAGTFGLFTESDAIWFVNGSTFRKILLEDFSETFFANIFPGNEMGLRGVAMDGTDIYIVGDDNTSVYKTTLQVYGDPVARTSSDTGAPIYQVIA